MRDGPRYRPRVMLRPILSGAFVASLVAVCGAATGCTSLLGDFEVSATQTGGQTDSGGGGGGETDGGGGGGGDGGPVDTRPKPEFLTHPRTPTGWRDSANAPIGFTMKPTGIDGTIYECRSGPEKKLPPAWSPCDGKQGAEPKHFPQSDQEIAEGTYRLEYRYRAGDYTSPVIGFRYYTLFKLDKAPTCPRPAFPDDGPRYSDAEFFAAAAAWSTANAGAFPLGAQFPEQGQDRATSPMWLENPFIKITFNDVEQSSGTRTPRVGAPASWNWPAKGGTYVVNERSVRHTFTMDPQRHMLLMKRQYLKNDSNDPANPLARANQPKACANELEVGSQLARKRGPFPRGPRKVDCEGWVFNSKGQALCLVTRSGSTVPVVAPIDRRPPPPQGGTSGYGTPGTFRVYTSQENAPYLQAPNGQNFLALFNNQTNPQDAYVFVESTKPQSYTWYKVSQVVNATYLMIDPNLSRPANQQYVTGCMQSNGTNGCTFRFVNSLTPYFVLPTGYVKLHEHRDHAYALGLRQPGIPSPFSKCETPNCNPPPYKNFLTFLPP